MSLPRLLAGIDGLDPMSLAAHRAVHGDLPAEAARRTGARRPLPAVADELRRSGLRGRGGGGFPLARKLASVLAGRGRPVVVVNGCDGEPASEKDRVLLERVPHLVIDGAVTCARILDADRVIYAVGADAPSASRAVADALAERSDAGRRGRTSEVVEIPAGYVSGHESAIVNFINAASPLPTATVPMVFERGVARRPTLVSNAETLAHVGLVARHGADWFREVGTGEDPGSTLVTVGGAIAYPGVFEIELGSPVESLLEAAGGPVGPPRAFLFGGYGGAWIDASRVRGLEFSERSLGRAGGALGPGVLVVLPASACPVAETARVAAWLERQSARQCGPCTHGLAAIAGGLGSLVDSTAEPDILRRLAGWAELVTGRGACAHPDGAARFLASGLDVFAAEFIDHAAYGRCSACARMAVLPLPTRVAVTA